MSEPSEMPAADQKQRNGLAILIFGCALASYVVTIGIDTTANAVTCSIPLTPNGIRLPAGTESKTIATLELKRFVPYSKFTTRVTGSPKETAPWNTRDFTDYTCATIPGSSKFQICNGGPTTKLYSDPTGGCTNAGNGVMVVFWMITALLAIGVILLAVTLLSDDVKFLFFSVGGTLLLLSLLLLMIIYGALTPALYKNDCIFGNFAETGNDNPYCTQSDDHKNEIMLSIGAIGLTLMLVRLAYDHQDRIKTLFKTLYGNVGGSLVEELM